MGNLSSTRSQILSLGKALAFQNAIGILVPIILVRIIDVSQYGQYRLFWLITSTVMLIVPMGMPRSLMYFIPRSTPVEKRMYIYQVFLFLFAVGSLSAIFVGPWNPILPEKMRNIASSGIIVPAFVFFWVLSAMTEVLPNADQNIRLQSLILIYLSITRVTIVIGTAMWKREINAVFLALIAFSIIKTLIFLYYSTKHHGWPLLRVDWKMMWNHLCYAVPFGLANITYTLRRNAEMWVVASIFSTSTFAIFTVGTTQLPLINVIRLSIGNVLQPKMSKLHSEGDINRAVELNQKGNLVASYLVFPIAAFCIAFADKIILVMFTDTYLPATPVMQIYLIAMMRNALEASTLLVLYSQGIYLTRINTLFLFLSIIGSVVGAKLIGPTGAAIGSVISTFMIGLLNFRRAASLVGLKLKFFQKWRSIFAILLMAAFCAAITKFLVVSKVFNGYQDFVQFILGGLIFTVLYIGATYLIGLGWLLNLCTNFKKMNFFMTL